MAHSNVAAKPESKRGPDGCTRTEIRHLYAPEPRKKGWASNEAYLLRFFRKLTERQRVDVMCYVSDLALKRISARLEGQRQRTAARRQAWKAIAEASRG